MQIYPGCRSQVVRELTGDATNLQLSPPARRNPERVRVARGATSTRGTRRGRTRRGAASTTSGPGSDDG